MNQQNVAFQHLHNALFHRPPEAGVRTYWTQELDHRSLKSLALELTARPEYTYANLGKTPEQLVDELYVTLYGRHADQAGLRFYSDSMTSHKASIEDVVLDMIAKAQGADADALHAKAVAAELFTTALNIDPLSNVNYGWAPKVGTAYLAKVSNAQSAYAALKDLADIVWELVPKDAVPMQAKAGGAMPVTLTDNETIQQLYIAYFKRPADVGGLDFWSGALQKNVSVEVIREHFAKSSEYQLAIKGKTHAQVIDDIYVNLFGQHADSGGLKFYGDALRDNKVSVDKIVAEIMIGAQGSDARTLQVKMVAAELFTDALEINPSYRIVYASGNIANIGQEYLESVVSTESAFNALRALPSILDDMVSMRAELVGVAPVDYGFAAG